jgi:uncharacterized SAM-binding protein YcdF (DUF218 family)
MATLCRWRAAPAPEVGMQYLSKILPLFVLPVGITLMLLVTGIVRRRRWMLYAAAAVLWLSSMPIVSARLLAATEAGWVRLAAADMPAADAIVVLSGGRVRAPGPAAISEWTDADRFFGGVELFQAGKAPLLVFTGGASIWEPDEPLEGDVMAGYARTMGLPADRIRTTARVFNTEDEANAVSALLRGASTAAPHVLLVTSAFHMPRARQLFTSAGITVTPFPVDFSVSTPGGIALIDLLPSAPAMAQTHRALRELYGRMYYRLRP